MTDAQHVADAFDRAYAGGPERHKEKSAQQGKLPVRERVHRLLDEGSFSEDALLANWEAEGLGRRRRRHRARHDRRPHRGADGQRPDGQGRLVGTQDRREDPAHPGGRARAPRADGLPRRLRGRAHHRAGPDVPRPPPRRPHLLQRGPALRRGAAGVRPVRPERGGRRLHPGVLRRRDHARRQRVDVPRLAADGRDGDRRARLAGGDGRRQDAHRRLRLRPLPRQDRRGGHRRRQAVPLRTSRPRSTEEPPVAPPARAGAPSCPPSRPTRTSRGTCTS